jgi:hypothetical protein
MRMLGIDPACRSIAWAIYDDQIRVASKIGPGLGYRADIIAWGSGLNWCDECRADVLGGRPSRWDYAAIEWPVIFPGAGNEVRDTIATAGIWWDRLGKSTLLIPRATVASALHVRGDARINAVMATLCLALSGVRKGLDSHHRAAAAVAYVAAGRLNMPTAARRKGGR